MFKRNLHIYNAKKFYSLTLYYVRYQDKQKKKCNVEQVVQKLYQMCKVFVRTHSSWYKYCSL